jgi:hypothetical protein
VTAKQRVVLVPSGTRSALTMAVGQSQIAAVCAGAWRHRGDLVTEALWL